MAVLQDVDLDIGLSCLGSDPRRRLQRFRGSFCFRRQNKAENQRVKGNITTLQNAVHKILV
jgi:hypothetical protein